MCGIFAYSGTSRNTPEIIFDGLKRLEYRGYDSWGIASVSDGKIKIHKQTGQLPEKYNLSMLKPTNVGIGHTRWATHGGVTQINAHPHIAISKDFVLAQNGIVENFQKLKNLLIKQGHKFKSQTDTEVIVKLIQKYSKNQGMEKAIKKAFKRLAGRNTIIILTRKGQIYAVKNGSPLVIGFGKKNEYFVSSDVLSFADKTKRVYVFNNYEMLSLTKDKISIQNIQTNKKKRLNPVTLDIKNTKVEKEGFNHFTLKEIYEQPHTIKNAANIEKSELKNLIREIKSSKNVYTTGAGTAGYAAGQVAYYLRKHAKINAKLILPYEVQSYKDLLGKKDLIIAFSQSGETADTIEALETAKSRGTKIASLVNMPGSTITRLSDFAFLSKSGPEIGVCSTKVFTAQITWGYLLSKTISNKYKEAQKIIGDTSKNIERFLNSRRVKELEKIAEDLKNTKELFILGTGQNYMIAYEGALKIKEISYVHAEAFSSGELKHGVIALVKDNTQVIGIASKEDKEAITNALMETKARKSQTYVVSKEEIEGLDKNIVTYDCGELDAISNVLPFQLLAYFLATKKKLDPDKPRNLAKSVTVK